MIRATNQSIPDLRQKFRSQKYRAMARNIGFHLSFEQWVSWWFETGKLDQRGRQGYCMARHGDTGPYAIDNIKCITFADNLREVVRENFPPSQFSTKELEEIAEETKTARHIDIAKKWGISIPYVSTIKKRYMKKQTWLT